MLLPPVIRPRPRAMRPWLLCWSLLLRTGHALTRVYSGDGGVLAAGWTAAGSVGATVTLSALDTAGHAGGDASILLLLPPNATFTLQESGSGSSAASVSLYLRLIPSATVQLELRCGVASAPLCVLAQPGGGALAAKNSAGQCSVGFSDASGWVRISTPLPPGCYGRQLSLRNAGQRSVVMSVTDVALETAGDLATRALYDINAQWCFSQATFIFGDCTLPSPTATCCGAFSNFSAAGCFCSTAVALEVGEDLPIAAQFASPSLCGGGFSGTFPDSEACFAPPSPVPGLPTSLPSETDSGAPPVPLAPAVPAPRIAPSAPSPSGYPSAIDVGPYVGIALATIMISTLIFRLAVVRGADEMLRTGSTECTFAAFDGRYHIRPML